MSEYIKREDAKSAIASSYSSDDAYDRVDTIPAADVEPVVRGEWQKVYENTTSGMKCAACGYEQFGAFPSFITHCFAATDVHEMKLEKVAIQLGKIPNSDAGDRVIAVYVCPNCGTLRIRIRGLR